MKKDNDGNIVLAYDPNTKKLKEPYFDGNEPTLNPIEIIDNTPISHNVEKLYHEAPQYVTADCKYNCDEALSDILKDYITYKRDVVPKLDDYKKYYAIYQQAVDSVTTHMIDIDAESQAKTKLLNQLNDPTKSTIADTISLIDKLKALDDNKHLIDRVKKAYGDKYKEPTALPTVEPTALPTALPTVEPKLREGGYGDMIDETVDNNTKI